MKPYRRFKRKYKTIHLIFVAIAIVMFWRGTWGILDTYFLVHDPLLSYGLSIFIAFFILFLDDFHLKELSK